MAEKDVESPQEETAATEGQGVERDVEQDGGQEKPEVKIPAEDLKKTKITGVFSTQSVMKVGTGTTTRKTIQKMFWMAEENDDGVIEMQPLNTNYIPSGPKRKVSRDDLLTQFSPEPEFYQQTVFPAMQKLQQTVALGEDHRQKGKLFSAEFEFKEALQVDDDNVKANFGLGLTYLDRGEKSKADNIFERLVKLDAAFEPEHKHLFNDFGISLRKNKMYDQSVEYYERAMELATADENLHYNVAFAYFQKLELEKTLEHLQTALKMNPDLEAAKQFLDWMKTKKLVTEEGAIDTSASYYRELKMKKRHEEEKKEE